MRDNIGNVLSQMPGRISDAIVEWKIALTLDPDLTNTHYQLGMALSRLPGRMPEAIEELEAAGRANPGLRVEQIVNRLKARQQQGKFHGTRLERPK